MTGDAVTGDAVTGDAVTGDAVTGDAVTGDAVTGDAVTGDGMTGDGMTGDGMTGDGTGWACGALAGRPCAGGSSCGAADLAAGSGPPGVTAFARLTAAASPACCDSVKPRAVLSGGESMMARASVIWGPLASFSWSSGGAGSNAT